MLPNSGGLVYGTITVGALLAADSATQETYGETIGAVAIALLIYWLAHAYSEFTEARLEHGEPLRLRALGRALAHELTIVAGAAVPLLALLICRLAGASLGTAVSTAIWTSVAVLVAIEVTAGVRAELTGRELVTQIAFGALLGLLVVVLRLVLHP